MARRRRSLLGTDTTPVAKPSAPVAAEDAPEAPAPQAEDAPDAPGPFHVPESLIPEAAPAPEPEDDVDPFEAPTVDVPDDPEGEGDGDLELDFDEGAQIPHGGDLDGFADAETQMDEYTGNVDAFDDVGVLDEPVIEPEVETQLDSTAPPPEARESLPPEPAEDLPPIAGMTTDAEEYGGFSGGENPPTEEVELYQDVSQRHNAPMNVPEPPPIPGIADRFTPPPVERTEMGSRGSAGRPSYLATPTPASAEREMFPTNRKDPGAGLISMEKNRIPVDDDDDDDDRPGMLRYVVVGAGGIALIGMCFGGALLVSAFWSSGSGGEAIQVEDDHHGVRIERGGIKKDSPEYVGEIDEGRTKPPVDPDAVDPDPEDPDAIPGVPAEGTAETPDPAPAAPVPKPQPAAKPKPKPVAQPEPVAVSKLKIRANRRVLVYVDGKAVGYTPVDYQVGAGAHEVVAMVAGKPESRQSKNASIAKAGDSPTVEFSF